VMLDIKEGADMVMVKPGLAYLDIIAKIKSQINVPIAAYNVSGEYSMIKAAAAAGALNEDLAIMETLTSFRRAGCDAILTYFAPQAAQLLQK
jgi:porphobilinogen synthase